MFLAIVFAATIKTATQPWVEARIEAVATNVYTKAEVDIALGDATPADYASVSNRAMSAVQTELDPTVPSWAKAESKPGYSYGEIAGTPTNVSEFANDAGYLTEHQSLANYYTKGEVDTAVANATPANYSTVSNRAMSAVQTETDPTVPAWAKASTKPSYALNDVCPDTENWLGVPGTTAGGKSIKVLAKTVNGVIEGGVTITGSSANDNNTTKYRYGGVAVKRGGVNTDYLWDTTSSSGIVRRAELAPFITEHQSLTNYYTKGEALGNTGDQTLNGTLSVNNLTVGRDYQVFSAMEELEGAYVTICGRWNFGDFSGSRIYCQDDRDIKYVAFLSDINLATNALDTAISGRGYLTEHQSLTNIYTKAEVDAAIAGAAGGGVTAVSVASGGTFGPGDLADGKVEMWRVTCAGQYTPSSSWHLIGYAAWPAAGSTWQCTVWRIGSAYYCNIIVVE